jgi:RNA-dependent RNA polymerase
VSPDAKMREIHLRPSQYKFHTLHNGLEIIRWSQFSAAHLNRQLISVLSALKVPDRVFVEKLTTQLSNLAQAMVDEKMALILLQKEIDPNQMTLALAAMVLDGFQKAREPFMLSILQLWRAWSIKYLKEKAKIVVHKGAVLLGCVDETRTLRGHFNELLEKIIRCSEQERINSLPEVFVQLSKGENDKPQVMLGPMALARNPSLHPGDIRVVRGVDVPALHHLKDVVVLPQTGDIDIAHMCSGGDLDGDDYLVIWDKDLLPREWNHNPMNYTPPTPVEAKGAITIDDITTFFVNYIKNNTLPKIAHAHLAFADYLEKGVKDDKCTYLTLSGSPVINLTFIRSQTRCITLQGCGLSENWRTCGDSCRSETQTLAPFHGEDSQAKKSTVCVQENPWPVVRPGRTCRFRSRVRRSIR